MLVIKTELWPDGDEETRREIGRMQIGNVGRNDDLSANYVVSLEVGPFIHPNWRRAKGDVIRWDRGQDVWQLVAEAVRRRGPYEDGRLIDLRRR